MAEFILDLVGDVNLRRDHRFDGSCLDHVTGELSKADLRLGNLEGCFADPTVELAYKRGWYHCQPDMVRLLVGNFDLVGCANNVHYGAAISESLRALDENGILHTGAGANAEEARRPAVTSVNGCRVGVLAFTSVFEPVGHSATETTAGVATIKGHTSYEPSPRVLHMPGAPAIVHTWPEPKDLDAAVSAVRDLAADVDMVVVYMHWGVSSDPRVHDYQRTIGHALVDAGARIVVGSHAHTPQGVEFYDHGAIFYGLGNFVFGSAHARFATRDGALAKLRIRDGSIASVSLLPVQRTEQDQSALLDPEQDEDGRRLRGMITSRCEEFSTGTRVQDGEIELIPPAVV